MESIANFITVNKIIHSYRGDFEDGYNNEGGYKYENDYDYEGGYGTCYGAGSKGEYSDGSGLGPGSGYESDIGYCYGSNDGIKKYCDYEVYDIDGICTIIYSVHGNYAIGAILNIDLTLLDCYVAKIGNCFAHGNTLKEAFEDARAKYTNSMPVEIRIDMFKAEFTDYNKKYPCCKLYEWHNKLTGSCRLGRESFAKEHNINIAKDKMTVNEFIELTENSYRGDIIKMLKN